MVGIESSAVLGSVDVFDLLGVDPNKPPVTMQALQKAARRVAILLHTDRKDQRPITEYKIEQATAVVNWLKGQDERNGEERQRADEKRVEVLYSNGAVGYRSTWNPQGVDPITNQKFAWNDPRLTTPMATSTPQTP